MYYDPYSQTYMTLQQIAALAQYHPEYAALYHQYAHCSGCGG